MPRTFGRVSAEGCHKCMDPLVIRASLFVCPSISSTGQIHGTCCPHFMKLGLLGKALAKSLALIDV